MAFFQQLKLAFITVFHNKMRSFVTLVCIVIGTSIAVGTVFISRSFSENIIEYLVQTANGVILLEYHEKPDLGGEQLNVTNTEKAPTRYTIEQVSDLRSLPLVRSVIPKNKDDDVVVAWRDVKIGGQQIETMDRTEYKIFNKNYQVVLGDMFTDSDFIDGTQSVLISQELARQLFNADDNPIGCDLVINNHVFLVKGVYDKKSGTTRRNMLAEQPILIPFDSWVSYTGYEEIQALGIVPLKVDYLEETVQSVEELLNSDVAATGTYHVMNLATLVSEIKDKVTNITLISFIIALLALLIGGVSLMDLMYISLMERRHEIAVFKALGLSNAQVEQQFLLEAVVLPSIGGLIGIVIAFIGYFVGTRMLGYDLVIYPAVILVSWLLIISLGLAFGLIPARRAGMINAADTLRHS